MGDRTGDRTATGPGLASVVATGPGLASVVGVAGIRQVRLRKALKFHRWVVAQFVLLLVRMTQPRFVLPGSTVMVTRRTLRRHHLFRPDPAIGAREVIEGVSHWSPELAAERVSELPLEHLAE